MGAKKPKRKARPKTGRPGQLTEKIIADAAKLAGLGHSAGTVAEFVGVSRRSVERWLERGRAELLRTEENDRAKVRQSEEIYVEFCRKYESGRASAKKAMMECLFSAAKSGDWRAAAWWLERANPGEYPGTAPIQPPPTVAPTTQAVALAGGAPVPRPTQDD